MAEIFPKLKKDLNYIFRALHEPQAGLKVRKAICKPCHIKAGEDQNKHKILKEAIGKRGKNNDNLLKEAVEVRK